MIWSRNDNGSVRHKYPCENISAAVTATITAKADLKLKNSNVSIQTESKVAPTKKGGLKIGKFHPGMYNVLVNKKFSKDEKRVDLQYILKQKPKRYMQIDSNLNINYNKMIILNKINDLI